MPCRKSFELVDRLRPVHLEMQAVRRSRRGGEAASNAAAWRKAMVFQ
jgi:hypothetical protein